MQTTPASTKRIGDDGAGAEVAEMERQLERERMVRLEEAVSELDAFTYSVAHDLRTPLHFIQGYAEAIRGAESHRMSRASNDHLESILRTTARLDSIIRDLLAYSHLSREELQLGPVSMENVVLDVLHHHRGALQKACAQTIVDPDLPIVRGHPIPLFQALSNLVSNAIKFASRGRPPRIHIWSQWAGGRTRLWVEDNGIGIAAADQQRIFRLFERIYPEDAFPGTGIGLALVRRAAERIGGRVGVESQPGFGSRFWIEFQENLPRGDAN